MPKKTYSLDLCRREYSSARIDVIADSEEDAYELAEAIDSEGVLEYHSDDSEQDDTQFVDESNISEEEERDLSAVFVDCNGVPIVKDALVKFKDSSDKSFTTFRVVVTGHEDSQAIVVLQDKESSWSRTVLRDKCADLIVLDTRQDPLLSDRDYWLTHGDCPKCRLGNTVQMSKGKFYCNKCNWEK